MEISIRLVLNKNVLKVSSHNTILHFHPTPLRDNHCTVLHLKTTCFIDTHAITTFRNVSRSLSFSL